MNPMLQLLWHKSHILLTKLVVNVLLNYVHALKLYWGIFFHRKIFDILIV
jgi:hypothetical protein